MSTNDCRIILSLFRLGENVIKSGCTDCMRQPNKAICLGEEQAFLLKLIIADNLQWDIQDGKIHIIDQEFLDSSLRCSQRSILPVLWNEELLQQGNKTDTDEESVKAEGETEEDAIKHYINDQLGDFKHWDKICEPIVLALAVNSCYRVVDRDALTHLCMNSKYGPVLFRKIIMRILSLLAANWFEHGKLEEIAAFFVGFLKGLMNYEYQSEFEDNVKARREGLCNRIKGSSIDMLYKEMKLQNDDGQRREENEDLLAYFARLENKERLYYASRLGLIQLILKEREVKEELWLPMNLVQLNGEINEKNYAGKIREVIFSINAQDESRQREAVQKLSKMLDLCVMDWIDEEVTDVHRWVIAG